jgi:hypothetical protein
MAYIWILLTHTCLGNSCDHLVKEHPKADNSNDRKHVGVKNSQIKAFTILHFFGVWTTRGRGRYSLYYLWVLHQIHSVRFSHDLHKYIYALCENKS